MWIGDLRVHVDSGEITLEGYVTSPGDIDSAIAAAASVDGAGVVNALLHLHPFPYV